MPATPESIGTLMVVSHNPGTHYLAAALADETHPDLVAKVRAGYPTNTFTVPSGRTWNGPEIGCTGSRSVTVSGCFLSGSVTVLRRTTSMSAR